ncbi:caspase Dronc isoform X1 [Spodoptera frugiperda]|uniref:Caspase Dronc isoform X1 n=2 Tax=Spodoptera frugiperda TaxID=7108 RepID=M4NKN4_SPOFR|nr:caspase Dronc isoform X1 [Spodoptera frugiperda]AGG91491.1 initiator caspase [Spodoptera frugiperda]
MQKEHREAIQNNFTSLVERTDLDSVVTALYEKGVFSEPMIEPFRNTSELERDRKRRLYMDIPRRGPQAFGHLVDTLGELGYWDLVRDLDPDSPFSFSSQQRFNSVPQPRPADNDNFRSLSTSNRPRAEPNRNNTQLQPVPPPPAVKNDNADGEVTAPPFIVKKSTKFMVDDDTKDLKLYRTRGPKRGILVDFTYTEFDNNIEEFRNGVDVDCNNLKYLFDELGFRRVGYKNLTKTETTETLKSLNNVLVDYETVFIVVSSHGYERPHSSDTDVRCKDGQLISLYDIMTYFDNRNMPALIGIPKVFIFQMCRGSNADYAWHSTSAHAPAQMPMPAGDVAYDGRPEPPASAAASALHPYQHPLQTPLYSDILIAHSTVPGLVAHRDGKHGSWYIQALCEVFAARAHDCHVEKLFTLVDKHMQDKFKVQTSSVDRWGFNKRLYLHPGLYE